MVFHAPHILKLLFVYPTCDRLALFIHPLTSWIDFLCIKQEAWDGNSILTPRRKDKYDATFTNLNSSHFLYQLRYKSDHWQLRVFRQNMAGRQEQIVKLPKNSVNGSYFGQRTCGADKTDAVPCEHMAAIALSAVIRPQITPMNVMPIWWKHTQWREQFPLDVYAEANITIKSIKKG
jgi:hypothetical protein